MLMACPVTYTWFEVDCYKQKWKRHADQLKLLGQSPQLLEPAKLDADLGSTGGDSSQAAVNSGPERVDEVPTEPLPQEPVSDSEPAPLLSNSTPSSPQPVIQRCSYPTLFISNA